MPQKTPKMVAEGFDPSNLFLFQKILLQEREESNPSWVSRSWNAFKKNQDLDGTTQVQAEAKEFVKSSMEASQKKVLFTLSTFPGAIPCQELQQRSQSPPASDICKSEWDDAVQWEYGPERKVAVEPSHTEFLHPG